MPSTRILSIDFGTSRCKTSVIDEKGDLRPISTAETGLRSLGSGLYEQDGDALQQSVASCTSGALRGVKSLDIFSITGQSSAPVCLDRDGLVVGLDLLSPGGLLGNLPDVVRGAWGWGGIGDRGAIRRDLRGLHSVVLSVLPHERHLNQGAATGLSHNYTCECSPFWRSSKGERERVS